MRQNTKLLNILVLANKPSFQFRKDGFLGELQAKMYRSYIFLYICLISIKYH